MNWIASLFKIINKDWTSRIFALVLILLGTYSVSTIFRSKVKCEDCTPFKEENKQLIDALIDIKKDLQDVETVSFLAGGGYAIFASYDTIPKRQNQQQVKIRLVLSKIDSILLRYRVKQDTLIKKSKI